MAYYDSDSPSPLCDCLLPQPLPYHWTHGPKPDWLKLPREVLITIFLKLDTIEIIEYVQKVCTLWRSVSKDSSVWTSIDMTNTHYLDNDYSKLVKTCYDAIDRSHGSCVDISIKSIGNDYLLDYIINSGCQLKRLRLVDCWPVTNEGLSKAAAKLPLLETFECHSSLLTGEALISIGLNCPKLTTLAYDQGFGYLCTESNEEAFAIAKHMPHLRHLDLSGSPLTNTGLEAILDGCPHLESLNLGSCCNIFLKGDLARKCERIKDLKLPYPYGQSYELDDSTDSDYSTTESLP